MMSDSFQDFLGSFTFESPDFKRALKILIKYEIHVLLQRLSDTGEESVVITASIADRTNGHLGSQKGRSFLRDAQIKALEEQFLHYCTGLEQPDRERRQELYPSEEDSPPVYVKQEPRSGFVGYRQGDVTRKERLFSDQDSVHEADRRQFYQNSHTESSISVDQSENSWIERMIPVEDSSSRVPFYQDSPEFFKDCYSERGLVGRCNDVCCRGTSLDFVGTSTRASIPSMDRSVINLTNNQDSARTHKDAVSYGKEKDYYGFVDMTLDRPEAGERLVGTSSKLADALSSAETVLSDQMFEGNQSKDLRGVKSRDQLCEAVSGDKRSRENLFEANNASDARNVNSRSKIAEILSSDKPVIQGQTMEANTNTIAAERNGLNGKLSDCLEKTSAFVPIENNLRNSVEFASKGSIGEDFSVKRDFDITVGSQKGGEEENVHGILTRKEGNSDGPKRKLCSRVPDYKLKSLLQTGADDLGKTDTFKGKVLVKKEPLFEGSEIESDGSVIMNEELLVRQNSEKQEGSPQGNKNALTLNIKEEAGQEVMSGYIKSEAESEPGEETPGSCKELGRSLRFVCHYCGQMFKNKQYREFHEKLHLAKFPYVCQSCGEGFNEEQSYEEHGKVHITNPLLNCESCGYRTTRKFRMNSHREICGKPSKVFLCPYCQKPFLAKRYMKVHMKSHDLSNVHHCPYCVNTYPLKNSLLKHIRTKHKIY